MTCLDLAAGKTFRLQLALETLHSFLGNRTKVLSL
jgi:hypothetical protein